MLTSFLLLHVAATWPLPGLGVLALPSAPTPHLTAYALHTALVVRLVLPDGTHCPATATVEEVTWPDAPTQTARGLLLDLGDAVAVLPGTEIWLIRAEPSLFAD